MNWYKQADFMGRDPYKVDFASEEAKAKRMSDNELIGALSDAIEASRVSVNQGKYTDQASVYRKALLSRGFSIEEQDARVKETPSLHFNPGESQDPMDYISCKICGQKKHLEDFSNSDDEVCDECTEAEQDARREGEHFISSGEYQNYPEFD